MSCGRALPAALVVGLLSARASGYDAGELGGKPLTIDVTETSIVSQRFDAREPLPPRDHGWGQWVNRLNVQAANGPWTAGLRLDSAVYWSRPADREFCDGCLFDTKLKTSIVTDNQSRFGDNLYPAKLWVGYRNDGLEVTLGDSYVQFGRGLTLSMRKLDELGVDTSLRGLKVSYAKDPFAINLVAGLANPTRVDEASGRSLFVTRPTPGNAAAPVLGADRVTGAEVIAGRGTAVVSATRVVGLFRCAPYQYDANGNAITGTFDSPAGSCADADSDRFLSAVNAATPNSQSRQTLNMGQSFEFPRIGKTGRAYLEVAMQSRQDPRTSTDADGTALYGTANARAGKTSHTVEFKSYRNYYPLMASVAGRYAPELTTIAYSQLPTAEPIIADSMFGNFNACATGGRYRADFNVAERVLVYGAAAYTRSMSEQPGSSCDRFGAARGNAVSDRGINHVWDFTLGTELRWDKDRSQLYASVNIREDQRGDSSTYYREQALLYTLNVYLGGPYTMEFNGRHRLRFQDDENLQEDGKGGLVSHPWWQGFHYTSLKIAPKWALTQGIEYFTLAGQPEWYLNAGGLYRLDEKSYVKLFVGQAQGGLRCMNGICRTVPAYEGARAEIALRF